MQPIKFTIKYYFDFRTDRPIYIGAIICLLQERKRITKKNIMQEIKKCCDITGFLEETDEEEIYEIYGITEDCRILHYDNASKIFNKLRR